MPPLGTTKFVPISPPEVDGEAEYHRTLDNSLAQMPYEYYEARTKVFRQNGVRTAYTFRNATLVPITFREQKDRDFKKYATAWELAHSKLPYGDGKGIVWPVVDENMTVIGHYGSFDYSHIFVPANLSGEQKVVEEPMGAKVHGIQRPFVPGWRAVHVVRRDLELEDYLYLSGDVIADKFNYGVAYYQSRGYTMWQTPQQSFTVVTDIEGHVRMVLSSRSKDGIKPVSFSPLDLISAAKLVRLGAGALLARTLMRRRAVAAQAAKRELGGLSSPAPAPTVLTQARQVTRADMMKWEVEGGHALQKHGPQHTRETLKARVAKREEIPAPQMQPGGYKPEDFRIWKSERSDAATRFESEEVMHRAIGEVINRNVEVIRRTIKNGGDVVFENQAVSFKTGAGWFWTVKAKDERGVFFLDNVRGITVVIRRRKNHVPTAQDPEEWYVHTAFPDLPK